jgi:hypothetical protein
MLIPAEPLHAFPPKSTLQQRACLLVFAKPHHPIRIFPPINRHIVMIHAAHVRLEVLVRILPADGPAQNSSAPRMSAEAVLVPLQALASISPPRMEALPV